MQTVSYPHSGIKKMQESAKVQGNNRMLACLSIGERTGERVGERRWLACKGILECLEGVI